MSEVATRPVIGKPTLIITTDTGEQKTWQAQAK